MPLSFFHHDSRTHYREVTATSDSFGHTFGGDPSSHGLRFVNCEPMHLLYRLNQADDAVNLQLPGVRWLPLCYHFSYAAYDGTLIYRVLNDMEIELIAPAEASHNPDFPYANFPQHFPQAAIRFSKQGYDPTKAEDAVKFAALFGVDQLSDAEMKRAVEIAERNGGTISDWGTGGGVPGESIPDWSPEDLVRHVHREPFWQGAPSKSCDNPDCTAEIAYRREAMTIPADDIIREVTGLDFLTMEACDVRRDSMRVFAIHDPDENDGLSWDMQLIFEICECCHCIRVSNQCD